MKRIDYYLGIFVLAGAIVLSGRAMRPVDAQSAKPPAPAVITAQEFDLVSPSGKVRAKMCFDDGQPKFQVLNTSETEVAYFGLDSDARPDLAYFVMGKKEDTIAVNLTVDKDGSGLFSLDDSNGAPRMLFDYADNAPDLALLGKDNHVKALIGIADNQGIIRLKDADDAMSFSQP